MGGDMRRPGFRACRELGDVEKVIGRLLIPYGFKVGSVYESWAILVDCAGDRSVCVVGDVVELSRFCIKMNAAVFNAELKVDLNDPGSLGVIEEWARNGSS